MVCTNQLQVLAAINNTKQLGHSQGWFSRCKSVCQSIGRFAQIKVVGHRHQTVKCPINLGVVGLVLAHTVELDSITHTTGKEHARVQHAPDYRRSYVLTIRFPPLRHRCLLLLPCLPPSQRTKVTPGTPAWLTRERLQQPQRKKLGTAPTNGPRPGKCTSRDMQQLASGHNKASVRSSDG